jgi:integrase
MVRVRDEHGKLVARSFATKEDAAEAELLARRKRQRVRSGLAAPADGTLFIDYVKIWLKRRNQSKVMGTFSGEESKLRRVWIPLLGNRPLEFISTVEVRDKLNELQFESGLSASTIDRHRACLHKLFNDAIADGKLSHNPITPIRLQNEPKTSFIKTWLKTDDEQGRYLKALEECGPDYGILGWGLLWTGGRVCEVNALQWQDIDLEAHVVRIRRIEERAGGSKIVERTKGKDKKKVLHQTVVPLAPVYQDALTRHKARSRFVGETDFIACTPDGRYIQYDAFKGVHKRALTMADLPKVHIHGLRRSFATNAKRAGFSRSDIKDMLGHSTELMTEKYVMDDADHLVAKAKTLKFGAIPKSKRNVVQLRRAAK